MQCSKENGGQFSSLSTEDKKKEISLIISKGDSGWKFAIISDDVFLFKKMIISN